jgi:probable rRNA maturation factor
MSFKLNYQCAVAPSKTIPTKNDFKKWIKASADLLNIQTKFEITIRIVNSEEIRSLNKKFRKKDKPTNVLSFPYTDDEEIGDIIICADVVKQEAKEQNISEPKHWAHMAIHGFLHLLGHDHQTKKSANEMEKLEAKILKMR